MDDVLREADLRDASDPLASFRDRFLTPDPDLVYLDGNSLGPPPEAARRRVLAELDEGWATGLVRSWDRWIDLPREGGELLAPILGAAPDELILADQTSILLYKLAAAALDATGRSNVVTDAGNFPSDRYILDRLATASGGTVTVVGHDPTPEEVADALDDDVGLVSLSLVDYRSGHLVEAAAVTRLAQDAGALVLWDLSHAAGVVPTDLDAIEVDLAVGCTYKYLNGGPGAPAFAFVRRDLQGRLEQPIVGWWGHDDMFRFEDRYRPAPDMRRFLTGTPPVLSMAAAVEGIRLTAEAGIDAIRAKSAAMTSWFIDLADRRLADHGLRTVTPRDPDRRGSHVSLAHPDAWPITQALRDRNVIVDHRPPDVIRYGFSPLVNSFTDVARSVLRTAEVMDSGTYRSHDPTPGRVT